VVHQEFDGSPPPQSLSGSP